ncbi:MAG: BatD family protein [Pirellulales bacterium]|nr:BatD family protein [Pirellulales bacterium]
MNVVKKTLLVVGLLVVTAGAATAAGPKPEVLVELERSRVYEGQPVRYRVTLNHVQNPVAPDLSGLKDFEVIPGGQQSLNSTQITIINGQRSQIVRRGRAYDYTLVPRRAGRLTIPGPVARVDGQELHGQAMTLHVEAADRQDLVRMEVKTRSDAVYPTQTFTVTLSIAVKALPGRLDEKNPMAVQSSPPKLLIPWADDERIPAGLEPVEDERHWLARLHDSDGVGFGINNLADTSIHSLFDRTPLAFQPRPQREVRKDADGKPATYWVYNFHRRFRANRPGRYTFGPVTLQGTFAVEQGEQGLLGEEVFAVARPLKIDVKQAPEADRPASYLGAIGAFDWSASLTPTEAKVGDPITLTLTLSGQGSLDGVSPPDLAAIPEVAKDFKTYPATQEIKGKTCRFTYTLRPLRADVAEFPPVPAAYFDVHRHEYVTLRSEPIRLRVSPADRLSGGQIVGRAAPTKSGNGQTLEARRDGIFANITDPAEVRNDKVNAGNWVAVLGGMFGLGVVGSLAIRRLQRRGEDPALVRRRTAVARARRLLKQGAARLAAQDTRAGAESVRAAVVSLVADAANLPESGLTSKDVCRQLETCGVDGALVNRVGHSLDICDAARYGASGGGVNGLAHEADVLFTDLVRSLRRQRQL